MEQIELEGTPDLCDSPHIMLELASEIELRKDGEYKKRKREEDNRVEEAGDVLRIKPPPVRPSGYDDDVHKRFRRSDERGEDKWKKRSHHESERLERLERERRRLESERHRHLDKIQKERDHERREKYGRMELKRRADRKEHRKSMKNSLSHDPRKLKLREKKATRATPSLASLPSLHPQRDDKKRDHKRRERRSPIVDLRGTFSSDEKGDLNDGRAECDISKAEDKDDISDAYKEDAVNVDHSSNYTSDKSSPVYDLYSFARSKFDYESEEEKMNSECRKDGQSEERSTSLHERNNSSMVIHRGEANVDKIESPQNNDDDQDNEDEDDEDMKESNVLGTYDIRGDDEDEPSLPAYYPAIQGCRNVEEFHCLNRINEGTYGVVYRAVDLKLREVVALKRLKMEKEKDGFPITSLREIKLLMKARHPNIVTIKEVVVGSNMDKIYLVMEYVEHDMKSLMESMKESFTIGEVKTLLIQLLRGVQHLHDNWIIHRDLKTSNLLLSHSGILKIGDFGLAREYGSPLKPYTPIVVTLWYRSPELLLGTKMYSTAVDMWSVGCIFGEFILRKPLFPGSTQIEQLNSIFKDLGSPNEKIWPGLNDLPGMKKAGFNQYQFNQLRRRFGAQISEKGFQLMNNLLTYSPEKRMTSDLALIHEYFNETPLPTHPNMFPTWPAKSELCRTRKSPKAPSGGKAYPKADKEDQNKKSSHGFLFKFPAI